MILPPTDSLILSADDDGKVLPPGATPLIVDKTEPAAGLTLNDYLQYLPSWARKGNSALRDAYLQTWAQMVNFLWSRYGHVLEAQTSPRFSETIWLDSWGQLLSKPRAPGEDDPTYRARLLKPRDAVTPAAIKSAVTAVVGLLSPNFTPTITYQETAVDRIYMSTETSSDPQRPNAQQQPGVTPTWWAFVQPSNQFGPTNQPGPSPFQTVNYGGLYRLWANYLGMTGNKTGAFLTSFGPAVIVILNAGVFDESQTAYSHSLNDPTSAYGPYDFLYPMGIATQNQTVVQSPTASTPVPVTAFREDLIETMSTEIEIRRAAGVGFTIAYDLPASATF